MAPKSKVKAEITPSLFLRTILTAYRVQKCWLQLFNSSAPWQLRCHRVRSNLAGGVFAVRDRLDPEPDGVQSRQEHERENRPAEGSADQGVRQRSPENRVS